MKEVQRMYEAFATRKNIDRLTGILTSQECIVNVPKFDTGNNRYEMSVFKDEEFIAGIYYKRLHSRNNHQDIEVEVRTSTSDGKDIADIIERTKLR